MFYCQMNDDADRCDKQILLWYLTLSTITICLIDEIYLAKWT